MTDHHDPDIQEQMDYEALNASTALKLSRRLVLIEKLEAVVDAAKEIADDYEAYESRGDCSGIYDVPVHDVQILAKWKAALAALEGDGDD